MGNTSVKTRESSFELLRILLMMMIIAGHVSVNHETKYVLTSADELIKLFSHGAICVAVNCFILLSGYFSIQYKKERLIRLGFQTFFYSTTFMFLALVLGWRVFNPRKDLFAFLPIITKQYWFVTCYVVLYIFSPWLNVFVDNLKKDVYRKFLIIGVVVFYLWPTINYLINAPQFVKDAGYGIVNFVFLYLLGRYINLYYEDNHSSRFYFNGYLLSTVVLFICQYSLSWILGFEFTSWLSYNTIFCLIGSVCLLLAFKNISVHLPIVNYWARPCLAVYLIHMAPDVLVVLCCTYVGIQYYHGLSWLLLLITLPVVIYFVCALIEICRREIMYKIENKIVSLLS